MSAESETERRNRLARERGFDSYRHQQRHDPNITSRADLAKLPPLAQQQRQMALDALAIARREGLGLFEAAERARIAPQAVAYWTGDAVTHTTTSEWQVEFDDTLFRPMFVYADGQLREIDVYDPEEASDVGRYHSAIGYYLATGDDTNLVEMTGVVVGGVELETDPDVIDVMARRGMFDFESIYRMVT